MEKRPTFSEALKFWFRLGLMSFGGPAGQMAIMHTELVERKRWISEERFLNAMNFCMLLPGPEAQQLATYMGWLLHGTRGGLAAGILFVIPSALILLGLSIVYVLWGNLPWMSAAFYGLKPAVVAIVLAALVRIGRRTLQGLFETMVALGSFSALAFFHLPFPVVILAALALGFFKRKKTALFVAHWRGVCWRPMAGTLFCGLLAWWTPIFLVGFFFGTQSTSFQQGLFFSKAAVVTFGGAYAVLPYVAQQAVDHFHWLSAHQILDGLALAETTPGPLIIVLQFVAFLGGWHQPGPLGPMQAAILGAAISTWATFAPSFVWVFSGAPLLERLHPSWGGSLSTLGAAVMGVMLNLGIWFAWRALLPEGHPDLFAVGLAGFAFLALSRWKWNVAGVLALCAAAGWLLSLR